MDNQELSTVASAKDIIFSTSSMQSLQHVAELMATSSCTVPKHLHGNTGDCFAIAMQALQWGMSPFSVAQKTFLVGGTLGYEAQLVNAVIQSSGAISGRFHYEYQGDGVNLSCRVGAVVKGESDITWSQWLTSASVTTKNSPLWKSNPRQQLGYLQVKNWARSFTPGAILGVYSNDELQDYPEREINPTPKPAAPMLDDLLIEIKGMSLSDFKNIDPAAYTEGDRFIIRAAMTARKKELAVNLEAVN
jgi:hypothetical protein